MKNKFIYPSPPSPPYPLNRPKLPKPDVCPSPPIYPDSAPNRPGVPLFSARAFVKKYVLGNACRQLV